MDLVGPHCHPLQVKSSPRPLALFARNSQHRLPRRVVEREEAMVGSSGVDMRKGTYADDCGYGQRSSLYSNGGRAEGRTCGAGVAASATVYH